MPCSSTASILQGCAEPNNIGSCYRCCCCCCCFLQDFSLTLIGGPTEQQLMEQRAAEYAAAEAHRRALLAAAEVALWEKVQLMAAEAAAEARIAFK